MSDIAMQTIVEAIGAPKEVAAWAPYIAKWRKLYACEPIVQVLEFADGPHSLERKSLSMAKRICEDWAGLLWTENAKVVTAEPADQALLEAHLGKAFAGPFTEFLEAQVLACGTGAIEVLVDGMAVREDGQVLPGQADLEITYIPAASVIPLRWANGEVLDAAFVSMPNEERLEVRTHRTGPLGCTITNMAYSVAGGGLQPAAVAPGVAEQLVLTGPPLFAILRPAIANNKVPGSPFGLSVLGNAEHQLETVDLVYDNFCRDFRLGRKVVFMADTLLRHTADGKPIPPSRDMAELYVALEDATGEAKSGISEHNPSLRVADNTAGIEAALGLVSQAVGMGAERYRYRGETVATATQIISENSELYRNRRKHLLIIEAGLQRIARALLWCGANLAGMPVDPSAQVAVVSDDSVIEDDASHIARGLLLLDRVMSKQTFLMEFLGYTEEQAKAEVALMGQGLPELF